MLKFWVITWIFIYRLIYATEKENLVFIGNDCFCQNKQWDKQNGIWLLTSVCPKLNHKKISIVCLVENVEHIIP